MRARLVSLDGHPDIPLGATVLLVGRHDGCDVRVESSCVSRRHCCLVLEGDRLIVRDLDSTNGTWVNGGRVAIGRLATGDELALGRVRYRFEAGPGPAGGGPPSRPGPAAPCPPGDDDPDGLRTFELPGPPRRRRS